MIEFFRDLTEPGAAILRYALAAGVLSAVACGVVGSFVVTRRITYIAGGIAHTVLGGIGAAVYFSTALGWTWLDPLVGGVVVALGAALIIGAIGLRSRQREDTVISALWSVGMAVGVLFISATSQYGVDPMTYLFGRIGMVSRGDLWLILGLDIVILATVTLFYKQLLAVCFDEEFARLRGLRTQAWYLLLLCLIALTVVALIKVVGIILVIALLALPAAIANNFVTTLARMMVLSCVLCVLFVVAGLSVSYEYDRPTGASIVILTGIVYLVVTGIVRTVRRFGR